MSSSLARRLPAWPLALLCTGLLACEDNESASGPWVPVIQGVRVPAGLADNSPDPYQIQVEINRPVNPAEATGLQVRLELSGPGLASPALWTLKDDGGQPLAGGEAGVLQDAGSSGDNIPGDLVFSGRGLVDIAGALGVDFSANPGSYQLQAVLLRDGSEVDRSSRSLSVGHNGTPRVSGGSLPASLASGDSLSAALTVVDPDGQQDLESVWLELASQPGRRWALPALTDTTFGGRLGPQVAARTEGASMYHLGATDRFGQENLVALTMDVDNQPLSLETQDLRVWQRVDGDLTPLDFADTLRLVLPLPGQSREVVFRVTPRDEQGPDDIRAVELTSAFLADQTLSLLDDGQEPDLLAGDGEFAVSVIVPAQAEPPAGQQLELRALPWLESQAGSLLDLPLALIPERTNAAPAVDAVFAPDTLASGDVLRIEAEFSDPDGSGDLTSAWVKFLTTGERWFMQRTGNRWGVTLPEDLVHFRESADYGFRVVVSDLFAAQDSAQVAVHLVNGAPRLVEDEMAFYRVINGNGTLLAGVDTVRLEIPAVGDTNFFVFTVPVVDDQGLAELDRVEWTIEPRDGSSRTTFLLYDDGGANGESADQTAGDGVFTGAMTLVGQSSYNNLIYFVDFDARDQLGNEATTVQRVYQLVNEESPGPIRPPVGRPMRFTLPSRPAMTAFGGAR